MKLYLPDTGFIRIKRKRAIALQKKRLLKHRNDFVEGVLTCAGKSLRVKVRLKGDHPDHFEGSRWSFRVIAKNGTILNHRKISVQGAHTRNYLLEFVFHLIAAEEGIVALQYDFFPFSVNDTLNGIYAVESHFDNHLLDRAHKPYGPIVKFDETEKWNDTVYRGIKNRDSLYMLDAPIRLCNKKWGNRTANRSLVTQCKALLNYYRDGKVAARDIFDIELWAKYIAVNELMASNHALRWHNLRFYYNPTTMRIEPIAFDCGWGPKDKLLFFSDDQVELFYRKMLDDEHLIALIRTELTRMSKKSYLEDLFYKHNDALTKREALLRQEIPNYILNRTLLLNSQKRIVQQLEKL